MVLCDFPPNDANTAIARFSSTSPAPEGSQSSSSSNGGSDDANNNKTHTLLSKRWVPARQKSNSESSSTSRRAAVSLGSRMKPSSGIFNSLRRKTQTSNDYDDTPSPSSQAPKSIIKKRSSHSNSSSSTDFVQSHMRPSTEELALLLQEMGADDDFKKTLGIRASDQEQQGLSLSTSAEQNNAAWAPSPCHPAASKTAIHRRPSLRPSIVSSLVSLSSDLDEEDENNSSSPSNDYDKNSDLDQERGVPTLDSKSMLAKLGPSPTSVELANVAAVHAKEYINECLFKSEESSGTLDREKWESIPQYCKSDLHVKMHLGMGSFSDAFEVTVMVPIEDDTTGVKKFSDTGDLDRKLEAKFKGGKKPAKDDETPKMDKEDDDLDKEIEAMFGSNETTKKQVTMEPKLSFQSSAIPQNSTRRLRNRCQSVDYGAARKLTSSICLGSMSNANNKTALTRSIKKKQVTYAMKCLRPQIRSDAKQFIVGVEDLVHETALLASLDHPNIIKLYGRAGCGVGGAAGFRLSDGYFILLDRLQDTLVDRIDRWKTTEKSDTPSSRQIKTGYAIADAMSYLHSKNIILRDLKPANVGFDSRGVLKLFDFGFAFGLTTNDECGSSSSQSHNLLYDICGTPRYMAPEVAFGTGYGLPADVHSFGILLWEICSLKKPFAKIRSHDEFYKSVYERGGRPKMIKYWASSLRDTMQKCWNACPEERPTMEVVKNLLRAHAMEMGKRQQHQGSNTSHSLRQSSVFRRLTG